MKLLINALHAKAGGGLIYFNNVLPHLAQNSQFDITVLCHQKYRDKLQIPKGVKVHAVSFSGGFVKTLLWEQLVLPFTARKLGAQVTLCIANYVPLLAPKPVALLTNNPDVRHFVSGIGNKFYWWALIFMSWLSVIRCPIILSNGSYLKDKFSGGILKMFRKKIHLAPSGCDDFNLAPIAKDPNLILAIGDFYDHKDYPTLLRAFKILLTRAPTAKLEIAGRGISANSEAKMKNLIAELGIAQNVTLLGFIPYNELLAKMASAAIYASPSRAETFSLTLIEALKLGTPAVVGDFDFQFEVGDKDVLYVPLNRGGDIAAAFAVAMFGLLENPSLAANMVKHAQPRLAQLTWHNTAAQITAALGKI